MAIKSFKQTFWVWAGTPLIALCILAIPLFGLLVSDTGASDFEKAYQTVIMQQFKKEGFTIHEREFPQELKLQVICKHWDGKSPEVMVPFKNERMAFPSTICKTFLKKQAVGTILFWLSLTVLLFTLGLILLIVGMGLLARKNRESLFRLFRPGLLLSQASAVLLTIANGAIGFIYLYNSGTSTTYLAILGLFALMAVLMICYHSFSPLRTVSNWVWGKAIARADYPELWKYVESIANNVQTTPPDTIIMGMEPTFYVTETPSTLFDGALETHVTGKILYISLPFSAILSQSELAAIIGHEMGHFVGDDTQWGKKFYPIYKASENTINSLGNSFSMLPRFMALVMFLPSYLFMSFFKRAFEHSEKKMARERELEADRIGAQLTSKETQAIALVKIYHYHNIFDTMKSHFREALTENKMPVNSITWFQESCTQLPEAEGLEQALHEQKMSHPTDTHPPLIDRLDALGIPLANVHHLARVIPTETARSLISDGETLEEELTNIECFRVLAEWKREIDDHERS